MIAKANISNDDQLKGLKLYLPKASTIMPLIEKFETSREEAEAANQKFEIMNRRSSVRHSDTYLQSWKQSTVSKIKHYLDNLKRYTEFRVTDKFSITIGSVKSGPLDSQKLELVDKNDVFHERSEDNDDPTRGYGLKFEFDL